MESKDNELVVKHKAFLANNISEECGVLELIEITENFHKNIKEYYDSHIYSMILKLCNNDYVCKIKDLIDFIKLNKVCPTTGRKRSNPSIPDNIFIVIQYFSDTGEDFISFILPGFIISREQGWDINNEYIKITDKCTIGEILITDIYKIWLIDKRNEFFKKSF